MRLEVNATEKERKERKLQINMKAETVHKFARTFFANLEELYERDT